MPTHEVEAKSAEQLYLRAVQGGDQREKTEPPEEAAALARCLHSLTAENLWWLPSLLM